ncbi:uncharacterized protein LOC135494059 [Lineus longissimus]|uniref:uncharacterized protein LOC135494059 n=1 Tax=Lineus longissimus TaxID=88925 RepID=UPI00315D7F6A
MEVIKQPDPLSLEGNVDHNWRSFKQRFEMYLLAEDGAGFSDQRKIAVLLTVAGQPAMDLFNTFELSDADRAKYDKVIEQFVKYCSPKKNETYERYVFRSRLQKQGETFDSFITDLRLKSKTCNFADLADSMLRDQVVFGIADSKIRERLLRESELSLEKAVKVCKSVEAAQRHVKVLADHAASKPNVAEIGMVNGPRRNFKQQGASGGGKPRTGNKGQKRRPPFKKNSVQKTTAPSSALCTRCGTAHEHDKQKCPAYDATCRKCDKPNHFARFCKTPANVSVVHTANAEMPDVGFEDLFIGTVNTNDEPDQQVNAEP